jgi:hypothetical protein
MIETPYGPDLLKADRLKAGGIKPGTWALKRSRPTPLAFRLVLNVHLADVLADVI